jgi:hypothetical protein
LFQSQKKFRSPRLDAGTDIHFSGQHHDVAIYTFLIMSCYGRF